MSVHMIDAKFLLLEVSTTTLSPGIWHMKLVNINEAKVLLLEVSTTTMSWIIWHKKSVHINEAKFLQLEVNTTTLSPSTLGQVSTARGKYYYIESQ